MPLYFTLPLNERCGFSSIPHFIQEETWLHKKSRARKGRRDVTPICLISGAKNAAIFDSSVKFFTMSHARLLPRNMSYNPIVKLQLDHFDKLDKLKSLWVCVAAVAAIYEQFHIFIFDHTILHSSGITWLITPHNLHICRENSTFIRLFTTSRFVRPSTCFEGKMVSEAKANTWLGFVVTDLEKVLMPFVTSQRVDICVCSLSKKRSQQKKQLQCKCTFLGNCFFC